MIVGMAFDHMKEDVLADPLYLAVEQKLLSYGGREMVYMPSSPLMLTVLLERGQTFDTQGLQRKRGEPSHCHDNAASLAEKHKGKYQMVHGYGLSPDGLWRQHSWLIDKHNTIIETTVPRIQYYGIVLSTHKEK